LGFGFWVFGWVLAFIAFKGSEKIVREGGEEDCYFEEKD